MSYDFAAHGVVWKDLGSSIATGRGSVRFCVIMSPCHTGRFVMVLFDRRRVDCSEGLTHFSYTRLRVHLPAPYEHQPLSDQIQVGCGARSAERE